MLAGRARRGRRHQARRDVVAKAQKIITEQLVVDPDRGRRQRSCS